MTRRMITYPTNRLLGVIDEPVGAAEAVQALVDASFSKADVVVLVGDEGRDRLDRLGHQPNAFSRIIRLLQFTLMDQTPDFLVYEHAILDGRAVVAVHVANRDGMLEASAVLVEHLVAEARGRALHDHVLVDFAILVVGLAPLEETEVVTGVVPAVADGLAEEERKAIDVVAGLALEADVFLIIYY